jgi:hypothetical protein
VRQRAARRVLLILERRRLFASRQPARDKESAEPLPEGVPRLFRDAASQVADRCLTAGAGDGYLRLGHAQALQVGDE